MSRRTYSREFKESAVKLVYEPGNMPTEASKSLGVDPSTLRLWLKKMPPAGDVASTEGKLPASSLRARRSKPRQVREFT